MLRELATIHPSDLLLHSGSMRSARASSIQSLIASREPNVSTFARKRAIPDPVQGAAIHRPRLGRDRRTMLRYRLAAAYAFIEVAVVEKVHCCTIGTPSI